MTNPALSNLKSTLDEIGILLTNVENATLAVERAAEVNVGEEAQALDEIRELKRRLGVIDSLLLADISKRTPYEERLISLPHGGTMEVRKSKPRKTWDHKRLASVVAEKIMDDAVDKDTGVIDKPTTALIQEMLEYVSITGWKVTTLKKAGIDPDKYCEVGDAKPSAQIRH